jgi:hypothetical protein
VPKVIGVEWRDILASAFSYPAVPSRCDSAILLMDEPDPMIFPRMVENAFCRTVLGTIVDHDNFKIDVSLRLNTGQRPIDCLLGIECRNDDADDGQVNAPACAHEGHWAADGKRSRSRQANQAHELTRTIKDALGDPNALKILPIGAVLGNSWSVPALVRFKLEAE